MIVGVFVPSNDHLHQDVLNAFAEGLYRSNTEHFVNDVEHYRVCDVAVIFGVYKKAVPYSMHRGKIMLEQRKRGLKTIIVERGYVNREDYFSVGWNYFNGRADFKNDNMPGDRWGALDTPLVPWKMDHGKHILIAGQVPWDAAVQHVDFVQWAATLAAELRKQVAVAGLDLPIRFRPHPKAKDAVPTIIGTELSKDSLEYDLYNAYSVVTFNSNTGVDAVINGVPTCSFDVGSMVWDVSGHTVSSAIFPLKLHREQWAHDLAYTQWNLEEMANGLPWRHLSKDLSRGQDDVAEHG